MTEHSKIPVPHDGNARRSIAGSSIERATAAFDINSLIAPPTDLPPEVTRTATSSSGPGALAAAMAPLAEERSVASPLETAGVAAQPAATVELSRVEFHGEAHHVDRDRLREQGLIVPEGTVTALLEEFRIIKRQILVHAADLRRQKAGTAAQRVLISSPHPGEGKTYTSLNLALSIAAEKESEVLLVDADFAKPSILSALGLPGGPGLMDALMDETIDAADCVLGTDIPGLWVLPAGDTSNHDSEYLSSSRTGRVLDGLTAGAPNRIVIFDSPPALAASPAAELAKYVGQVVVVVRADSTGQGALEDAISLLNACPNVQLLLNGAQFSPSGRRFGTYYGYKG